MSEVSERNEKIVDQHTQQAKGYAQLTGSMADQRAAAFRSLIGANPDDELLDVACGPGTLSIDLAPHIARATGLDLTAAMLGEAREAQARNDLANIEWIEGDAAAMPFPDETFSLVVSRAAFHHFSQPQAVLREMARVCKPGGRVVISDVTPKVDKTAAYDRMEKMRDPSHGHAHSVEELTELGRQAGLGDASVQTGTTGPMPFEAVLATSFPEEYSREELLDRLRQDATAGDDQWGFSAALADGKVMVSYRMSTLVWTKP
jgi:ubiquinone/menaquinone biosynthesis C-methylase UbiE